MTSSKDACETTLYVQPVAKMCGIAGEFNEALKIKKSATPVDGAGNDPGGRWFAQKVCKPRGVIRFYYQDLGRPRSPINYLFNSYPRICYSFATLT